MKILIVIGLLKNPSYIFIAATAAVLLKAAAVAYKEVTK